MPALQVAAKGLRPARQDRSRESQDRLLAAAEEAFAKHGYDGARMIDIAKAAGSSIGSAYFRFKDKEALFGGVVERFAEDARLKVAAFAAAGASGGSAALVRAFVSGTAALFFSHKGMFRAILERSAQYPRVFVPVIKARLELDAVLDAAIRQSGMTPGPELDLRIRVATQMVFGFLLNAVINPLAPAHADGDRAIGELGKAVLLYLGIK
jgi:AcrR family transcriptional regulator